jgi:hypothetical protein
MLNKITLLGLYVVILAISLPAVVLAQEEAVTTNLQEPTQQIDQSSEVVVEEDSLEKQKERIERAKQKVTDKLSLSSERKIRTKCKVAQTKIGTLQSNVATVLEKRTDVYTGFNTKLNELVAKLKVANVDTASLEASIAELNILATTASTSFTEYTTILSDMTNMDCETDPQGFAALLTEARSLRASVLTAQNNVISQLRQQIKTDLEEAKKSLNLDSSNTLESEDR